MDPKLVAYGAAFWGWTNDESEALLKSDLVQQENLDDLSTSTISSLSHLESNQSFSSSAKELNKSTFSDNSTSPLTLSQHDKTEPQYIVFHKNKNKSSLEQKTSKKDFKAFMSSNTAKVLAAKNTDNLNKKDMNEEEEAEKLLLQQDKELKDLLESTKLIEQYASEELVGKSRRYYQTQKLVELGMKPLKKQPVEQKTKLNILKREKKQQSNAQQLVKNMGLHTSKHSKDHVKFLAEKYSKKTTSSLPQSMISFASLRNPTNTTSSNSLKRRKIDRGLNGTIGRFKKGMLEIRPKDIKRVEKLSEKKFKHSKSNSKRSGSYKH